VSHAVTDDPDQPIVDLLNRQELPVDLEALVALARRTLRQEGAVDAELSVSLVPEAEIEDLHRRYLDEPGPTDVLSFPQDQEDAPTEGPRMLGDVVICPAVAARQNRDLQAELRLLLVHGILHLLGYDHQEEEDRRVMWDRQEAYAGARP
jgi:probable rRNA maturation factor